MSDQHEGPCDRRGLRERGEVVGHGSQVGRPVDVVAETEARAVVGADLREFGDLALNEAPRHHAVAGARFQHDGRLALALAMEVELALAVDRDELTRLLIDLVGNDRGRNGWRSRRGGRVDQRECESEAKRGQAGA